MSNLEEEYSPHFSIFMRELVDTKITISSSVNSLKYVLSELKTWISILVLLLFGNILGFLIIVGYIIFKK